MIAISTRIDDLHRYYYINNNSNYRLCNRMKNTCIQSKCIGMHLIFLQPRFLIEFPTPPQPTPLLSHYTHIRLTIRCRRSMYTIQLINSLVLHIILDLMDLISSALACLVLLHFKEDEDRVIFRVYSSCDRATLTLRTCIYAFN